MMNVWLKSVGVALVCVSMSACGEGTAEVGGSEDAQESSDSLLGGKSTLERPEIGRVFFQGTSTCTATLIHPRVVVTAKHCVDFGTCDGEACESARMSYEVLGDDGRLSSFIVKYYRSIGVGRNPNNGERSANSTLSFETGYALNDDVALLLLSESVPSSVATPAKLATAKPDADEALTVWGYGCTAREDRSGAGLKRKVDFEQNERSNVLCPGDSGGPVTSRESGELYFVNSGYWIAPEPVQTDIFGDVVTLNERIDAQMQAWGLGEPEMPEEPEEPVAPEEPEEPMEPEEPQCVPYETQPPQQGMPMRVSLVWPEPTDLDLFLEDPAGNTVYYGNRTTPQGAQLKKADCVTSSCPPRPDGSDYSEWIEWSGKPLQGEYKVWAVNYNGRRTANFMIQVESDRGDAFFEGRVSGARQASQTWSFTYKDQEICR